MRSAPDELVMIRATSAFVLDGEVVTKGAMGEVSKEVANDLFRRGKAEPAPAKAAAPQGEADKPPPPSAPQQQPSDAPADLESLTKAELLEKAKELGVEVKAGDNKAQILAALTAKA